MESGLISQGNGYALFESLKLEDSKRTKKVLQDWKIEAEKNSANAILISAEALIHVLAKANGISLLSDAADKVGITSIEALGYLRDFADHAISTYKHRAKSGKFPDFDEWLVNNYETPLLLLEFAGNHRIDAKIDWSLRKFRKQPQYLINTFFTDWLKLPSPGVPEKNFVNESLNFSEILLMNELAKQYKPVIDHFYKVLKEIPVAEKADEQDLANYYYWKACKILSRFEGQLEIINDHLSDGEKLIIGDSNDRPAPTEISCRLTQVQLRAIIEKLNEFQSLSGALIIWRRRVAGVLPGRISQKVISLLRN